VGIREEGEEYPACSNDSRLTTDAHTHVGDKATFAAFVQNGLRPFLQEPGTKSPAHAPAPTRAPEETDSLPLPLPE